MFLIRALAFVLAFGIFTAPLWAAQGQLAHAAEHGSVADVQRLIHSGASVNERGFRGATPLMMAAKRGLPEMMGALLAAGADTRLRDSLGRTALMFAGSSGEPAALALLLDRNPDVNQASDAGDTALMAASGAGNPEPVRMLLQAGASVNLRDRQGRTALIAGARGQDGIAEAEYGRPRREIPDESVHRDHVVRLLIEAGADIAARDSEGESALFVNVKVPQGNLSGEQMRGLADLAERAGDGNLRFTMTQNVVLAWVPQGMLKRVY